MTHPLIEKFGISCCKTFDVAPYYPLCFLQCHMFISIVFLAINNGSVSCTLIFLTLHGLRGLLKLSNVASIYLTVFLRNIHCNIITLLALMGHSSYCLSFIYGLQSSLDDYSSNGPFSTSMVASALTTLIFDHMSP